MQTTQFTFKKVEAKRRLTSSRTEISYLNFHKRDLLTQSKSDPKFKLHLGDRETCEYSGWICCCELLKLATKVTGKQAAKASGKKIATIPRKKVKTPILQGQLYQYGQQMQSMMAN